MARRRKTLPKDFAETLDSGDLARIREVFDVCEVDARGGYTKRTALAFDGCPPETMAWLVGQGASLSAEDDYGETPLHSHAGSYRGRVSLLLGMGADVRHGEGSGRGTPLHRAASGGHAKNAALLLAAGAPVDALDRDGLTPLELALRRCGNASIQRVADLAETLVEAGARMTPRIGGFVTRIGTDFEFHRQGYDPDEVEATSAALDRIYALSGVPPVARRDMHDGVSPIVATADGWEERNRQLWDLLVPSSGAASTVQGEVIRIPGRIARELDGNGGVNWGESYRMMADAWLALVGTGTPLPAEDLAEAGRIVADVRRRDGDTERMRELATEWVCRNPDPVGLPTPAYSL